jgi:general stress protein YciG
MSNTRGRGFASMDAEKQREIASKGGRAAHAKGTAHQFTPDEARDAGRKGGLVVSQDRQHMSTIGREGGQSRGRKRSDQGNDVESDFVTSTHEREPATIRREFESEQHSDRTDISMRPRHEE